MSRSNRRTFVNLSVFAGSAALFAATWTGVVQADQAANEAPVVALPTSNMTAAAVAMPPTIAAVRTQPAPVAAPRQVVVVRQSRAS